MFIPTLFGKKKNDDEKDKQTRELRLQFPSIRRPNNDDAVFEMLFEVGGAYSTLRIYILPDFPTKKPVLQVAGPITHRWLDAYKQVTGCQELIQWTKNSCLTDVVQRVMTALQGGINVGPGSGPSALIAPAPLSAYPGMQYNPRPVQPIQQQQRPTQPIPSTQPIQRTMSNMSPQSNQNNPYPALPQNTSSYQPYSSSASSSGIAAPNYYSTQNNGNFTPNNGNHSTQNNAYEAPSPYIQSIQGQLAPPVYESAKSPISTNNNYSINTSNNNSGYNNSSNKTNNSNYDNNGNYICSERSRTPESADKLTDMKPPLSRSKNNTPDRPFSTQITVPPIPSSFPQLSHLSSTQLERLLHDEVALQAIVKSVSSVESMEPLTDQLRESNHEQAVASLARERELTTLQSDVKTLQTKLKSDYSDYLKKVSSIRTKHQSSFQDGRKKIEEKREKLDKQSEGLSHTYITGEISLSVFLQEFLETRTNYHKLSLKLAAVQ